MKIPGKDIALVLQKELKAQVSKLKQKGKVPHLVTILVGHSPEQESFVAIKRKFAQAIGAKFTFLHLKNTPSFQEFVNTLKTYAADPKVTGIIIQQPPPPELATDSLYNYLPTEKEIEGHKEKTPFYPPLGLAVLTGLKYVYGKQALTKDLLVNIKKDGEFFRRMLKNKRIVLIGRGLTGGIPIGKTLSELKINYLNTNSSTYNAHEYYQEADVIIAAAGRKVVDPSMIKPGVVLLTVGLRKENGKLKGDYDVDEIADVASYYSPTPGGLGPLDVVYLYKNLLDAAMMQKKPAPVKKK